MKNGRKLQAGVASLAWRPYMALSLPSIQNLLFMKPCIQSVYTHSTYKSSNLLRLLSSFCRRENSGIKRNICKAQNLSTLPGYSNRSISTRSPVQGLGFPKAGRVTCRTSWPCPDLQGPGQYKGGEEVNGQVKKQIQTSSLPGIKIIPQSQS